MGNSAYLAALGDELVNDPQTLGYTAHVQANWRDEANAAADIALLNTKNIASEKAAVSTAELFEAFDDTEWAARTADQKDDIKFVFVAAENGQIDLRTGTKARNLLQAATADDGGNGVATNTRNALTALLSTNISRAEQLAESTGFGEFRNITIGQVQTARRRQP